MSLLGADVAIIHLHGARHGIAGHGLTGRLCWILAYAHGGIMYAIIDATSGQFLASPSDARVGT